MGPNVQDGREDPGWRAARYVAVRRRRLQQPVLYPLATAAALTAFWGLLVLMHRVSWSDLSSGYLFSMVFGIGFEEAWYVLAVIAALVVALHVVALGAAVVDARQDPPALYEQIARGRQLQLLARIAAVVASVVAVDAVIGSFADVSQDSPFRLTEAAVLVVVGYVLGAFGEDAARRAVGPDLVIANLESAMRVNELQRLRRARVFWRPSQPNRVLSIARLASASLLALLGAVIGLLFSQGDLALALLLTFGVLAFDAFAATSAAVLLAMGPVLRSYLASAFGAVMVVALCLLPIAASVFDALGGQGNTSAPARIFAGVFGVAWLYPWLLVAAWLLSTRPYDIVHGHDLIPALSSTIVYIIDKVVAARTAGPIDSRLVARRDWWARATGEPWVEGGDLPRRRRSG